MKPIRLTEHTGKNIVERDIPVDIMYETINNPDIKLFQGYNRFIYMKLYFDSELAEEMLLRVIIEEELNEIIVVTVYKTSKIDKYFKR